GSTAHPWDATRLASGGAATTSTSAERRHGRRGGRARQHSTLELRADLTQRAARIRRASWRVPRLMADGFEIYCWLAACGGIVLFLSHVYSCRRHDGRR